MTKEEKAKLYDEAKLRMSRAFNDNRCSIDFMNEIFPELKESEDEMMVKFIKNQLFNIKKTITENYELDAKLTNAIDWLEKQGEHNPTNKVEPKFKVGDWVVNKLGDLWHIDSSDKKNYQVSDGKGNYNYFPISKQEEMCLWTIQDAKDGDVLACESGWTCIFKKLNHNSFGGLLFDSYCFIDRTGWFCDGAEGHTLDERINGKIYPATKEQCDTLLKAMADAGWQFDFEKKELKKIEQKPAWSEEDDKILKSIIINIENLQFSEDMREKYHHIPNANKSYYQIKIDWLKSLKDRVQPKQEWSEEDEKMIEICVGALRYSCYSIPSVEKAVNWLKSLRLQNTWKPSEEQMEALNGINVTGGVSYAGQAQELRDLYNDLKKLREE